MVKKVLAIIAVGLLCMTGLKAQDVTDATIDFEDIQYWVGEGSDSAVLIVNFGIPDTAFAWGYRFNGSATVQQMTDAITAADPRFWVVGRPSYYPDGDIFFVISTGDTLSLSGVDADNPFNYWEANINGGTSYSGNEQELVNGDVFKYGDQRAPSRVCLNEMEYEGVVYCLLSAWPKAPTPVSDPNAPVEATIDASEIVYWVGEGSNQVVLAVNWADTALAWGYKFSTDSVSVQQVMDDIMEADSRFSWVAGDWGLGDILFAVAEGDTLRGASYYWESKRNGFMDAGLSQMLGNGDFEKWCDPTAGVVVDSMEYNEIWYYTYVYPMEIHPVSVPVDIAGVESVSVMVWPNPTTSLVNVSVSRPMQAELYDLAGRRMASYSLAEGSTMIDLSALQSGVYMLRAEGSVSKIVKR